MIWASESAYRIPDLSRLPWTIAGCQLLFLFLDLSLNPSPQAAIAAIFEGPFQSVNFSVDYRYFLWFQHDEIVHLRDHEIRDATATFSETGKTGPANVYFLINQPVRGGIVLGCFKIRTGFSGMPPVISGQQPAQRTFGTPPLPGTS